MSKPKILFVLGTRPEAIKCAPVIQACRADDTIETKVLVTSQHRELQDSVLWHFGIEPDIDLDLMGQTPDLVRLVREAWTKIADYLTEHPTGMLLVQGDTTTAFIAALSAQYHKVSVAHIEAGLRTFDKTQPFPEELNRKLITHAADLHFAPTPEAKANLLLEGIDENSIHVVGNPGIDALLYTVSNLDESVKAEPPVPDGKRLVLVTCHRRENWGSNLEDICEALKQIAEANGDIVLYFLVHPNPNVKETVHRLLDGIENIRLIPAVGYREMAVLLKEAYLILTDSGGIQEEAPTLGKPVLVLRNTSERGEMLAKQAGLLLGTDTNRIVETAQRFLDDEAYYQQYSHATNVYGDGRSAERILQGIKAFYGLCNPPEPFVAALD